jgi:hypothetical protein
LILLINSSYHNFNAGALVEKAQNRPYLHYDTLPLICQRFFCAYTQTAAFLAATCSSPTGTYSAFYVQNINRETSKVLLKKQKQHFQEWSVLLYVLP